MLTARRKRQDYQKKAWMTHPRLQLSITLNEAMLVVRLYAVAGYNTHVAVQWLCSRLFQGKVTSGQMDELSTWVEDLFLGQTDESLDEIWHPTTSTGRSQLKKANRLVKECDVCQWLSDENVRKGVAPRTECVMEQFEKEMAVTVQNIGAILDRRDLSSNVNRMFALRFRRRWGISMTRMKERAPLDVEALRRKAAGTNWEALAQKKIHWASLIFWKKCCVFGPNFGPSRRSGLKTVFVFLGPKMGPYFGPKNGTVFLP